MEFKKSVHGRARTDILGKKKRDVNACQPLSHKGISNDAVNANMTDCLHSVIFGLLTMISMYL